MELFIIIFILLIFILLIGLFYYGNHFCKLIVYPKKKTYEDGYNDQIRSLSLDQYYLNLSKENIEIKSPYGYDLKGVFIENKNSDKCIIICHGITVNLNYSVKYIKPFYDRGFSVLLYDHRNHGESGGDYTSMGYFEKYDLKAWADYLFNRYDFKLNLGVLGESMGAATVMLYAAIDDRISFCIEDCGYSDLFQLFSHRLLRDYKLKFPPILWSANLLMKLRFKWDFKNASPINFIDKIKIPMLFIHGSMDDYVPTYMIEDLYNKKSLGINEIFIASGADHANALISDFQKYDEVIDGFLKKINLL